jgi:hypothetical protein
MAQRQSVNFPGFSHSNPIPNASRIGNIMMTSVISGVDPGTRNLPSELDGQVADNIIKINFYMKGPATGRAALNGEWVKMFPDANARPARHTMALGAESNALVTCDFTAVFA